jgi:hypothetical protein
MNLSLAGTTEQTTSKSMQHPSRSKGIAARCLILSICLAVLSLTAAKAQEEEAAPATVEPASTTSAVAMPQYSTITSTNNTVQASRLPVTYEGKTYYVDLTIALTPTVSSKGVVTVAAKPTAVASPNPIVSTFKAGTYVGPSNINGGKSIIVVAGPSVLPNGGTAWTLSTNAESSSFTYPDTAVWYVEPIASNPLASRIIAAKITSTAYSFGVGDSSGAWCNNSLLGFAQVGNTLSISNFTNCADNSTPIDNITYTLVP